MSVTITTEPVSLPTEINTVSIINEASQAAFKIIADRFAESGYPVTGDITPGENDMIDRAFEHFVWMLATNNPIIAEMNRDA